MSSHVYRSINTISSMVWSLLLSAISELDCLKHLRMRECNGSNEQSCMMHFELHNVMLM